MATPIMSWTIVLLLIRLDNDSHFPDLLYRKSSECATLYSFRFDDSLDCMVCGNHSKEGSAKFDGLFLEWVLSEVINYHRRIKTLLKALSLGTKCGKDYRRSLQGTICGFPVWRIEKTAEYLIG